jgi:hypothetical protein
MKVQNMVSVNGNSIPNQFIITDGNAEYFQSYQTIVAKRENGKITISSQNPYSVTTSKYLYQFLNISRKEFNANIKTGKYQVANLNGKDTIDIVAV